MISRFAEDAARKNLFGKKVIQSHEIGDYQFIETHSEQDGPTFFIYLNGGFTHYGEDSLDAALLTAIAFKYDGRNSQAAHYFARMIGMSKE